MPRSVLSIPTYPLGLDANRRQSALALASTLDDVIAVIPTSYREPSRTFLKELWEHSKKMSNARISLETLQRHKALGTWPPALRGIKPPTLLLSSEFTRESADAKLMISSLDGCSNDYKAEALDCMIATKKAEVEWFITERVSREKWLPKLEEIAKNTFERTKKSTEYRALPIGSQPTPDGSVSMLVPDWVQAEYRNWRTDLPHVGERVLSLAQNIGMAKLEKKIAKTTLKEKADVEMTDVGASKTMQETISDEVKKAVAAALKQKGVSAPPRKKEKRKIPTGGKGGSKKTQPKKSRSEKTPTGKQGKVEKKKNSTKGSKKSKH